MRPSALARGFRARQTGQDRQEAAQVARQAYTLRRRVPLSAGPDLTYGDMMMAEAQANRAVAMRQGGRFQGGSAKEIKSFDCLITAPAAGIAWAMNAAAFAEPGVAYTGITELNDVLQGAGVYERVGVKILMRSVRIRATLTANASPAMAIVRMAVIYDRQPNGAAPAIADIFTDTRVAGATTTDICSGVNISNKNRFTILRDQMWNLDSATSLSHVVDWFIPCRLQTEFKASAGTIADISTGSLLLVTAGLNVTSFANMFQCRSRIRYED